MLFQTRMFALTGVLGLMCIFMAGVATVEKEQTTSNILSVKSYPMNISKMRADWQQIVESRKLYGEIVDYAFDDINNDGYEDLILIENNNMWLFDKNTNREYRRTFKSVKGAPEIIEPSAPNTLPYFYKGSIGTGDVDGDGEREIIVSVVREWGGERLLMNIEIYSFRKSEFVKEDEIILKYSNIGSLITDDINNDGLDDIITEQGQETEGYVVVYTYDLKNKKFKIIDNYDLIGGRMKLSTIKIQNIPHLAVANQKKEIRTYCFKKNKFKQVGETLQIPSQRKYVYVKKLYKLENFEKGKIGVLIQTNKGIFLLE